MQYDPTTDANQKIRNLGFTSGLLYLVVRLVACDM